jgi:mannose-1-phosphate guanylyltransferase
MSLPAYAIILAGGYGTRFWPASRRSHPKQFLALTGRRSLLQQTYERLARLFPPRRIYVVGNAEHRALLRRQLPRLPARQLLLEPVGRNTAAAIALAAAHIRRRTQEALLAVFPADHAIVNQRRFRRLVRVALATAAAEDTMVVLGIPPTEPHTGYGYIERAGLVGRRAGEPVFRARCFTEKPDARTAAGYLRTGRYTWNSGMFFWKLSVFSAQLHRFLPRTAAGMEEIQEKGGAGGSRRRLRRIYPKLQDISVDYALAEPAARAGMVRLIPAAMGWSDLGSWAAVFDWHAREPGANVHRGSVLALDAHGNYLDSRSSFLAAVGIEDLIVVHTPDALLVCRRDRAQQVGKVVEYLRRQKRRQLL